MRVIAAAAAEVLSKMLMGEKSVATPESNENDCFHDHHHHHHHHNYTNNFCRRIAPPRKADSHVSAANSQEPAVRPQRDLMTKRDLMTQVVW
jgi:hypothetical protein